MSLKVSDVFLLLSCCVALCNQAAISERELQKYQQMVEGQGLFQQDDDVTILTEANFEAMVYERDHATLVEFYNSWCGFCQRFAPLWKALATDVKGWKEMVDIAAIDCSDPDNSNVCREFDIAAYPTLRYIHERYTPGPDKVGVEVLKGEDFYAIKRNLLTQIGNEQREGRGKQYPNMLPYTFQDTVALFDDIPSGTKFVFLSIEDKLSYVGAQVALDLHDVQDVLVRYAYMNHSALIASLGVKNVPALVVVDENKNEEILAGDVSTRESARKVIREYLEAKSISVPDVSTKVVYTGRMQDVTVPSMDELNKEREKKALKERIKQMGDVTFQADLENALRFSLKREVALHRTIEGEALKALTAYVKVLVKYFPFGKYGQQWLGGLMDKILASGDSVKGSDLKKWVEQAEKDDSQVFSSPAQWLGCAGSTSAFRGHPCGLWKLFHFLTVAAVEQNIGNENAYPREILDAMHGYIKNFFGCGDCAKHFQQMALEKDMKSVASLDSAVLWLWMAHNIVNKRLASDPTEDPEYLKVQFPLPERCPGCRNRNGSWNYAEVLQYLRHVYSSINIRYLGSNTRVLHMGLEGLSDGAGDSFKTPLFRKIDTTRVQEKDVRT